jgi:hypothetical protein
MNPCGAQWPWPPGPNGSLPRAAYRKCLCRKRLPTIFSTTRFGYAAAERAIERPGPLQSSGRSKPKHYRRWKVCRTRDEQPISGGEYSPSSREQLGRQGRYARVTL